VFDVKARVLAAVLLFFTIQGVSYGMVSVDSDWLEQHLNDSGLVLIDMSADSTQYQRFHIPGAIHFPYKYLTQRRRDGVSVRVSDNRLQKILGYLGIDQEKQVVIYDDMGGLEAGRLLWELHRIGHQKVSVLDGGLVKWIHDGKRVISAPVEPKSAAYDGAVKTQVPNEASLADVQAAMKGSGAVLLDVRSQEEYVGSPRAKRSGHIPGARWWPWDQTVKFDQGFVLKDEEELLKGLKAMGIDRKTPIITYCHTGHRAAQGYYVLKRLGFENVKLYDGSMAEWSKTQLPLKTGMQP